MPDDRPSAARVMNPIAALSRITTSPGRTGTPARPATTLVVVHDLSECVGPISGAPAARLPVNCRGWAAPYPSAKCLSDQLPSHAARPKWYVARACGSWPAVAIPEIDRAGDQFDMVAARTPSQIRTRTAQEASIALRHRR